MPEALKAVIDYLFDFADMNRVSAILFVIRLSEVTAALTSKNT